MKTISTVPTNWAIIVTALLQTSRRNCYTKVSRLRKPRWCQISDFHTVLHSRCSRTGRSRRCNKPRRNWTAQAPPRIPMTGRPPWKCPSEIRPMRMTRADLRSAMTIGNRSKKAPIRPDYRRTRKGKGLDKQALINRTASSWSIPFLIHFT